MTITYGGKWNTLYESVPYIFPTYREQTYIIPYKKMHLQLYEEAH